jgi:hypothetical protein
MHCEVDYGQNGVNLQYLEQRYSTFFVRVPPDIISLELSTPRVVDV